MKDKEKQIEEMANDIYSLKSCDTSFEENCKLLAYDLFTLGWIKSNEDSVVLSREERQVRDYECYNLGYETHRQESQRREDYIETLLHHINDLENALLIARKETAEKIFKMLISELESNKFLYGKRIIMEVDVENLAKQFGVEIKE